MTFSAKYSFYFLRGLQFSLVSSSAFHIVARLLTIWLGTNAVSYNSQTKANNAEFALLQKTIVFIYQHLVTARTGAWGCQW